MIKRTENERRRCGHMPPRRSADGSRRRVVLAVAVATMLVSEQGAPFASAGRARAVPPISETEPGWRALFDGKTLDGWILPEGPDAANFKVRDGLIHVSGRSGWMRTVRKYGDFTLRAQVRFVSPDGSGNSGIFLRSPETSTFGRNWPGKSFEVETRDMRVNRTAAPPWFGQVLRLGGNGGPAPEGRATFDAAAAMRAYARAGDWQDIELIAHGDRLWVYVNGELTSSVWGVSQPDGHVGLQAEDGEVEFRSLRIHQHRPQRAGFRPLLTRKTDLQAWHIDTIEAGKIWRDGAVQLMPGGSPLRSKALFADARVRVTFRLTSLDDLATLRMREQDSVTGEPAPDALDVQLRPLNRERQPTSLVNDPRWIGAILQQGRAFGRGEYDTSAALKAAKAVGEWQVIEAVTEGQRMTVLLNGIIVSSVEGLPYPRGGPISLKGEKGRIEIRSIEVDDPMGESMEAATFDER